MITRLITLMAIVVIACSAKPAAAQNYVYKQIGERSFVRAAVEPRITFNNFRGSDRDSLPLTYAGLGSMSGWLLFDNIHVPVEALIMTSPSGGITIGSGFGFIAKKYRFQDPWIIDNRSREWTELGIEVVTQDDPNSVVIQRDEDPQHDYYNMLAFFGPNKSKLVLSYLRVPLTLGYRITDVRNNEDKFNIQLGGFMDVLLGAKHKRKYENGGRQKAVIRGNNRLLTESIQFGVMGRMDFGSHFGIYAATMLRPLFQEDASDLDLYPVEFAIYFSPF